MFSGIILAGGKSSRMGRNKAELMLNNKTLVDHIADVFEKIDADEIIVNTNTKLNFNNNWNICRDIIKDLGPLGGIYSSLLHSKNEINIFVPCDSPFVNEELLIKLIEDSKNYEFTTICYNGGFFPLISVIKKNIVDKIKNQIDKNNLKVQDLIKICKSNVLHIENINWSKSFNPEKVLFNVNTKKDYEYILSINENENV